MIYMGLSEAFMHLSFLWTESREVEFFFGGGVGHQLTINDMETSY